MKKILVTGSNGFIGKYLVRKLQELGFTTLGFDIENGDIALEDVLNYLEKEDIAYVFHLAGKTFIPESWIHPFGFYRTNVLGTTNILEFCRKTGAGLTYISSYLYGNPQYLPVDEKHPVNPYNPYTHSKRLAEEVCSYYRNQFKLDVTILRPFNVYGPGQSKQFLIPELISKIQDPQVQSIEVMDLRPKRDFVYIDDFVEALILSMHGPRDTYNVGSGTSVSVLEVINIIQDITGIQKTVNTRNVERPMEIFDLYADIKKISDSLHWIPRVGFVEGLTHCIKASFLR